MKPIKITIALAVATVALWGCNKNVAETCDYEISPWVQQAADADTLPATGLTLHAFFVEPKVWTVASAEDAAGGVITNLESLATRRADVTVTQEGDGPMLLSAVKGGSNMLLVVSDPANGSYAWRDDASIPEGMENIYVELIFKPYRSGPYGIELRWNMVNPVIERCDYGIRPSVQETEDGDTLKVEGLRAYVFMVERGKWAIASEQDAQDGVITNKDDGTTRRADMTVMQSGDGDMVFEDVPSGGQIMLLVSYPARGIYAWRDGVKVPEEHSTWAELIFRPWKYASKEGASYSELNWNMVNIVDPDKPVEPEVPEEPEVPAEPDTK
jgi:hypothetical protein